MAGAGTPLFRDFIDSSTAAINALKAVPGADLGDGRNMRSQVYKFVQAQVKPGNTDDCAFIKDLQCIIHQDTLCTNGFPVARQNEAISLACGHSYCRECICGWRRAPLAGASSCPMCHAALPSHADLQAMPKNIAIDSICRYFTPRPQAAAVAAPGGGTRRRRKRISRK
jgi:hypothetical protein